MSPQKTLYDDERLFKGYLEAILAGRSNTINAETGGAYAIQADIMFDEHRRRFPK